MSEQLWGTYSVADHCTAYPFVADLVLYDRLVVPVPPEGDDEEWTRWRDNCWEPDLQALLLEELGDYVRRVPWTAELRANWNAMGEDEVLDSAALAADDIEMTADQERAERAGRRDFYGDTRRLVSKVVGSELLEGDDARVLAVYGTPDKFERHWRIGAAFPFLTRQTTVERSEDYDVDCLGLEAQHKLAAGNRELSHLLVANLVLPMPEAAVAPQSDEERAKEAKQVLLRARELLEDSDVSSKRRALHAWIAAYEPKKLPNQRKVQEFDELLRAYNDAASRKRKAKTVERSVLVLQGGMAGASMVSGAASLASGPVGIIGTLATSRLYQPLEWQPGDIRAAALLSEAQEKIRS